MERLHIIDGYGYIFRAYYGLAMAGARRITVRRDADTDAGDIALAVTDDGPVDPHHPIPFPLALAREELRRLGGALDVSTELGEERCVRVVVPRAPRERI